MSSSVTRERLLRAGAEVIAQVGWGRVTTRAVAARAGLPHGAVSYHFSSKEYLLQEAALKILEDLFPPAEIDALSNLDDLFNLAILRLAGPDRIDPVARVVAAEAMREAERNEALRERMVALLRESRQVLGDLLRSEQRDGTVRPDLSPSGLAVLLAAAGDGLLLHAFLEPDLNVSEAIDALRALVATEESAGSGRRRHRRRGEPPRR